MNLIAIQLLVRRCGIETEGKYRITRIGTVTKSSFTRYAGTGEIVQGWAFTYNEDIKGIQNIGGYTVAELRLISEEYHKIK